jgi:hypothetical protein
MGNTNNDNIIICYKSSDNKGCVRNYITLDSLRLSATFVCDGLIFYIE